MLIFIFNQLCSNTTHSNLIMIFSKLYYNQNISMVSAYFMHQQSNEFVLWCTFGFWSRNLQKPLLGFHPILMGINIMITWDFECKIRHSFYKLIELQSMFFVKQEEFKSKLYYRLIEIKLWRTISSTCIILIFS